MWWIFGLLVLLEFAAIAVALRLLPGFNHANEAGLLVAVNGAAMVLVAKRLRKKKDCCS
jgi:hypothetical protein